MLQLDERRFNRFALSILVVSFTVLIVCFGAGFVALTSSNQSKGWVDHTYQVISEVAQLEVSIERSETASRGYLLSPEPIRLQTFRENVANVDPSLARLGRLIADNPIQRINVTVLRRQTDTELAALDRLMTLASSSGLEPARDEFRRDAKLRRVNAIRVQAAAIRAIEERLLVKRTAAAQSDFKLSELVLGIAGVFLIMLAVGATWLVRRYTVDLAAAQARLHLLNSDLEGAVADRTKELSLANDEIQRFAYIVSHDLRSPLVNVMGFTAELSTANQHIGKLIDRVEAERPELLGEDARLAAREDLPEAIGFIRSSTQKMNG